MKKLNRKSIEAPAKLLDDTVKKGYYTNLRDAKNKIRPRWNTIQENNKKVVREQLIKLSNGCCAYCGKRVRGSEMDVDHFLPSSMFPYLAYCWDNLLPSCKRCNQTYKRDFVPNQLNNSLIIEECMEGETEYNLIYSKDKIFEICTNSRIIEPSVDNIEDHLEFNPEIFAYKEKSTIGKLTKEMFFNKAEVIEYLEKLSEAVKKLVERNCEYDVVEAFIELDGYEFYYKSFYEYWKKEKEEGRL